MLFGLPLLIIPCYRILEFKFVRKVNFLFLECLFGKWLLFLMLITLCQVGRIGKRWAC